MTHGTRGAQTLPRSIFLAVLAVLVVVVSGARAAHADAVRDWNQIALGTTAAAPFDPPRESHAMAIVHAAVFDAVNAIVGEFDPYASAPRVHRPASAEAAAIAAAHRVLVELYPAQQSTLDAARAASLADIPDGRAKAEGIRIGLGVAADILALRSDDGAADAGDGGDPPPARPIIWTPTSSAGVPASRSR